MPRPPRPDDLFRLRIASEPQLSPDGRSVALTVQTVAPGFDGYRHAIWLIPTDGSGPPRQLTIGARHDRQPRFSPDGRTLAFISDRRLLVEDEPTRSRDRSGANAVDARTEREDRDQVHLLPLDGGEARRLTDLPRGVEAFEWSPDGTRMVVVSSSHEPTRDEDDRARGITRTARAGEPPESDYRFIDRLEYMLNGKGFTYDRVSQLWLVDVATGSASRLTTAQGLMSDAEPAWSPDGTQIAFIANRRRNADIVRSRDLHVVDVATRAIRRVSGGGRSAFQRPVWMPAGRTIAVLGHRFESRAGTRNDVWLFAADGSDAGPRGGRNLSAAHDLMPGSGMGSDVTPGEAPLLAPSADGQWIAFTAPIAGSYELWRIRVDDGRIQRLTHGRHYISGWTSAPASQGGGHGTRFAYLRSTASAPADLWVLDAGARDIGEPRRLTNLNAEVLEELDLREPVERHVTVEDRDIQGWFLAAAGSIGKPAPLVLEIHGGPHTLYGWSLVWEFQILAAAGIGVFFCNPRGSEGYGQAFNDANHRDWGPGPMRDVLAGVDALVEEGLADPHRLGVTGGSYGGYLTNWIIGHDDRFQAAMTCRSVSDMGTLFIVGDLSGGEWPKLEHDVRPWEDPAYYREISPLSYADRIHTPLLIQHSERDLRTTIVQAEALFTILRSLRRPVRLLRVPEETHELTRSGTPFRRVENLRVVESWFRHFLVDGKRNLPPLPKVRGGR